VQIVLRRIPRLTSTSRLPSQHSKIAHKSQSAPPHATLACAVEKNARGSSCTLEKILLHVQEEFQD
jgi:hypothetical protein